MVSLPSLITFALQKGNGDMNRLRCVAKDSGSAGEEVTYHSVGLGQHHTVNKRYSVSTTAAQNEVEKQRDGALTSFFLSDLI